MEREIRLALTCIDMLLMNVNPSIHKKGAEEFSMAECIKEAVARYPFDTGELALLNLNLKNDYPVKGNKILLIHVFFNLIKNALYYIAAAGKGQINIWLECAKPMNKLYFKDTGTGIPKPIINKIFKRFFTKTPHGAGIGLTFCKTVMRALGGEISCESIEGEYTLFTLNFPKTNEN